MIAIIRFWSNKQNNIHNNIDGDDDDDDDYDDDDDDDDMKRSWRIILTQKPVSVS